MVPRLKPSAVEPVTACWLIVNGPRCAVTLAAVGAGPRSNGLVVCPPAAVGATTRLPMASAAAAMAPPADVNPLDLMVPPTCS
jgi:hypothetical protein